MSLWTLEPLPDLQRELDTLRSQRRDAATMALSAGYLFDEMAPVPSRLARSLGWCITVYAIWKAL